MQTLAQVLYHDETFRCLYADAKFHSPGERAFKHERRLAESEARAAKITAEVEPLARSLSGIYDRTRLLGPRDSESARSLLRYFYDHGYLTKKQATFADVLVRRADVRRTKLALTPEPDYSRLLDA